MKLSRRTILRGASVLPFAVASWRTSALAQTASAAPASELPPILFVHGNGDYDALWMTTLWRMESNGIPRERMLAINFTDPMRAMTTRSRRRIVLPPKISAASWPLPSLN